MGWLVSSTLASMVASFIAIKILEYIFGGVTSGFVSIARLPLFVVTWTAITARLGMHGFTRSIRGLRKGIAVRDKP